MNAFSVDTKKTLQNKEDLNMCVTKLIRFISEIENVSSCISLGSSTGEIKSRLDSIVKDLNEQTISLKSMTDNLENILKCYEKTEKAIMDYASGLKTKSEEPDTKDNEAKKDGKVDWKEIKEILKELGEDLGMSIEEILSLLKDLKKIVGAAGIEALFGGDTDWEKWFMEYVPDEVSDATVIALFAIMSLERVPKDEIKEHKKINKDAWKEYLKNNGDNKYLEKQDLLSAIKYGNLDGDDNTCGVIATYNALQYLTDGAATESFPDLLEYYEKSGIAAKGEFGTSPHAINKYFEQNGYDTKMITGDSGEKAVNNLQNNYDTYIMLAYNDKNNLGGKVHYVSITNENGKYVIHNSSGKTSFDSLQEAVTGYNDGKGSAICLMGIGK